jgi:uncharacterized protein YdeI (YjbR/CyaY-like superfamily)
VKNPAVDAYIAKSAPFARPVLARVRALMHRACPQIEETIKWGVPHFEYRGIVGNMAAFKQHAAFGFWSRKLLRPQLGKDAAKMFPSPEESSMGGRKLRSVADMPSDALILKTIKAAVALNSAGVRPSRELKRKPPPKSPPYLVAALAKNAKARANYERFTPAQRREYVDWLRDAKQDATRERRLATTVAWLAEGKQRNWKYQGC